MKKFANDLDPLDAADGAAARRRQVKCQQPLGVTFKKSIEHADDSREKADPRDK